jgi:multidrug transporter EmrE-like cation transporter
MNLASFAWILLGVLLNASAQLLLKAGTQRSGPIELNSQAAAALQSVFFSVPAAAGLACYAISVIVWVVALSRVEVSVAYPMLSIGYVVNALGAWMLFGEALSPLRLVGIGVIVLGVCLLAASGRPA